MTNPPPDKTRRHSGGRPSQGEAIKRDERLIAIAASMFMERGFEGTSIDAVAEAAGVGKATLYARYKGKLTGTFGSLATQSFHETKNITCGEGGALLVNDPDLIERALILREKGTNRSQFFRGQVDKYTWVDIGSSYLPSDLLAAFLLAQLEAREQIQQKRQRIWETYRHHLVPWAAERNVRLPIVPADCEQAYHMFYLLLPSLECRQALIAHLKAQGILSVFHYVPLHSSPMGRRCAARETPCPVTDDLSLRLLRLPFFNDLTEAEQSRVIAAVTSFACRS